MARLGEFRPDRWLIGLGVVTAGIWVSVLVVSVSAETPRGTPRGGARGGAGTSPRAGSGAPDRTVPAEPTPEEKGEAALAYVEANPLEFTKGRAMLAERLASSPPPALRDRLTAASAGLEERFLAAAVARLAERTATARALAEEGDFDGMTRALGEWPAELAGAPQEAEAKRRGETLKEEMLAPGRKILAEGEAAFVRWDAGQDADGKETRDLSKRLDETLAHAPREPVQRPRLLELRARIEARLAKVAKGERGRRAQEDLVKAFALADVEDGRGMRDALETLANAASGATDLAGLVGQVVVRGREVDDELASRLSGTAAKPWAAVVDGRLFVAKVETPPPPRAVFGPVPLRAPTGAYLTGDLGDLLAAEPDLERAASWLVLVGMPDLAATMAPADGPVRRLLGAAARAPRPPRAPSGEAWAELDRRLPFLLRVPGSLVPALAPGSDPVLAAWAEAIKPPGRGPPPPAKAPAKPSPALLAARAAFLVYDHVAAWTALEQAAGATPKDAEVALLRVRVLEALAAPARTEGVDLLALCEARRAWDLDPSAATSSSLVAERCLKFRARHPGPYADALTPVTVSACEDAARLGSADAEMVVFAGEQRLAEKRPKDAAPLLRRAARDAPNDGRIALLLAKAEDALGDAKKAVQALERAKELLGDEFPAWAKEMLARLSKR